MQRFKTIRVNEILYPIKETEADTHFSCKCSACEYSSEKINKISFMPSNARNDELSLIGQ